MLTGEAIAAGVVAGHVQRVTTPDDEIAIQQLHHLVGCYDVLCRIDHFLKEIANPEKNDIFEIVTLYKVGFGRNWIPRRENDTYIRWYAPVATAVQISSPLGSPFTLTIPAVTYPSLWLPCDFPDGSSIILDATASSNQMNVFVRHTRVAQE